MKVKAYVDGSYNEQLRTYGGGIVILGIPGIDTPVTTKVTGNDPDFATHRNISGELFAVLKALKLLTKFKDVDEVEIYHDYTGIAFWVDGTWQAKKPISQLYKRRMAEYLQRFKITFVKVKGHSGDTYNNMADTLAREATYEEPVEGDCDA